MNARSPAREQNGKVALSAENLTKTYGRGAEGVRAVDGIDLEIGRGTAVGLLGPNGAGKTTTIKMLLGTVLPDEGSATVDGVDVIADPRAAYRSVGAMLEGARNVYWRLTVRENLRFFTRLAGRPLDAARIDELLESVGLVEKADVTVNELSRGMKQKASLACTLARETPIAFLDEPTLGLDVESSLELRRQLRRLVEEESRTVLLSSHDMDVIEDVCDRVVIMNDGRIVADDTVENLIEVFRTQAYRITLNGSLTADLRRQLAETYGAENWRLEGDRHRFDATRVQGEEFYAMMDVLRDSSAGLLAVESLEPDLEDVFLSVTAGSDDGAAFGGASR
ncbi:ABC transporter ATP-binding protein [Natrononativus amylolyticus]|uniref:ABC transporter ATP-binding protein n=1 Tax=Natrononativus amylolyticus TaxID=2963434 RepID=UPI0020CDCCE8|nr:ABC transporter ATP-binding protein [Natrononativus amylolyticus]